MVTLQKAVLLFLGEYKPTTRKSYEKLLQAFVNFVGPARAIESINPAHVLEFMQHIDARPTVKSVATYNGYIKTLRTFFNWCIRVTFIPKSPVVGVRLRPRPSNIPRTKAMPNERYSELVQYAHALEIVRKDSRPLAFVLFLGDTGCRVGGAANLQWSDINFAEHSAHVTEKGKGARPVFFGMECGNALKRWRLQQRQKEENYVFSRNGQRIQAANLSHYFRRLCLAADIGSWGPHSLRHRLGYELNDRRISPSVGAAVLGDTVEVFLSYYSPQDEERMKAAVRELAYKGIPLPSKIRKFKAE